MFLFNQFADKIARLLVASGVAVLLPVAGAMPSLAGQTLAGPYTATVERVIDGDTLAVRVPVWIGQELRVLVRVRGIDAPERRSRCAAERALAKRASAYLAAMVASGPVRLTRISGGKYFGRILADVTTAEGNDVARRLLSRELARPYRGKARAGWC
jgi:endonuclease YncB( thermonuclease family)